MALKSKIIFIIAAICILVAAPAGIGRAQDDRLVGLFRDAIQAYNASNYREALAKGGEALELARKSGNKRAVGAVSWFLGGVHAGLEEYEKALGYYEEALAARRETGDKQSVSEALNEIGIVHSSLGRYGNALRCHEEALGIDREIGNRQGVGTDVAEIGIVYSYLGRYEKALGSFDEALAIEKEFGDRNGAASDLAEIGIVYLSLGRNEKALGYLEEALAIHRESGARRDAAGDLAEIGIAYANMGRYDDALKYYEQGLAIEREIGDRYGAGKSLGNIGSLYLELGSLDLALGYFRDSLEAARTAGDLESTAINYTGIGTVYSSRGQNREAYDSFAEGVKIATEIGAPEVLWRAESKFGKAGAKLGKDVEAASHYEKAIDTIESMRAGLSEHEARIAFMSGKVFVYDELIELYSQMHQKDPSKGYDRKAFEIFERKQGRVFLEEMGKSGAREFAGLPADIKDRETDLESQAEKARAAVVSERSKGADRLDTARLLELETEFRRIRAALQDLRAEIAARYPDYYALKYPQPAGPDDIRKNVLGPDEAMLVYSVMQDGSCVWLISKKNFGLYALPLGENKLARHITSFRNGTRSIFRTLTSSKGPKQETDEKIEADLTAVNAEGEKLRELLIPKEASDALAGAKILYIVPSGPLYSLPFEALPTGLDEHKPRYLVEDYPIAYLSSASLLKTLREARSQKAEKARYPLLAFANPVYGPAGTAGTRSGAHVSDLRSGAYLDIMGGSFLELPETEDEAKEIKGVLSASDATRPLQLRQDAAKSNVLKLNEARKLSDYRFVVFSCHGIAPDETNRVVQPALVLSQPDPAGGDGFLTMADTFGLRLNADLVTLSACNTGIGTAIRGEGVIGLTRAFMYAGTPTISVTLWSVESMSAKTLTTGLYENITAGMGPASALREIKLRMIRGNAGKTYRAPFFWAPVVLFGDGR